ncbi:hypothetical protein GCM10009733_063740 [Nonomuraea maheshkhaliensis]|uniref:Uncharacterized protein n=1 Tax=Nonomuraea maheshkhaliensis TaxID=419590 RepID=A0ABP4RQ03_9ACTN
MVLVVLAVEAFHRADTPPWSPMPHRLIRRCGGPTAAGLSSALFAVTEGVSLEWVVR